MTPTEKITHLERENHALRRELARMERRLSNIKRLSASQAEAMDAMDRGVKL